MLVVGADDGPGGDGRVGVFEHLVLHVREVVPPLLGLQVHFAQFPLAQRVGLAPFETSSLLLFGDGEVEFDQNDAVAYQPLFEAGGILDEGLVLVGGAEAEDGFHHGAVVPAAVEEHDLSAPGKLLHVALEIPLGTLLFRRLAQGYDPVVLLVHITGDPADRTALSRGVSPFEEDDHLEFVDLQVLLEFDQFGLVGFELFGLQIFAYRFLFLEQNGQRIAVAAHFDIFESFQFFDLFVFFRHDVSLDRFFFIVSF